MLGALRAAASSSGVILIAKHDAVAHTGTITETTLSAYTTAIATTVFAGYPNSELDIDLLVSCTNNANNKIIRVKNGSTSLTSMTLTTSGSARRRATLKFRNSLSSQVALATGTVSYGTNTNAALTFSFNFATAQTLTLTAELANTADTITIEALTIRAVLIP